jgi:hypothetical protein
MLKGKDIDSSTSNQEILWCISCGLEGKPEELYAKAEAIAERIRRNSSPR